MKMEIIGCLETAVTTNLRCVKFQKNEDLLYTRINKNPSA